MLLMYEFISMPLIRNVAFLMDVRTCKMPFDRKTRKDNHNLKQHVHIINRHDLSRLDLALRMLWVNPSLKRQAMPPIAHQAQGSMPQLDRIANQMQQ